MDSAEQIVLAFLAAAGDGHRELIDLARSIDLGPDGELRPTVEVEETGGSVRISLGAVVRGAGEQVGIRVSVEAADPGFRVEPSIERTGATPVPSLADAVAVLRSRLAAVPDAEPVMALFATVERCRAEIADTAEAFRRGHDFGAETLFFSLLTLERDEPPPGVEAFTEVRVLPGTDADTNDLYFRLLVEVAESGFRVASSVEAHLDVAMGDCGPGSHVLHHRRSGVLALDAALTEARAQAAALRTLDDHAARLGLPSPPV
jgi:hypothetical protein